MKVFALLIKEEEFIDFLYKHNIRIKNLDHLIDNYLQTLQNNSENILFSEEKTEKYLNFLKTARYNIYYSYDLFKEVMTQYQFMDFLDNYCYFEYLFGKILLKQKTILEFEYRYLYLPNPESTMSKVQYMNRCLDYMEDMEFLSSKYTEYGIYDINI